MSIMSIRRLGFDVPILDRFQRLEERYITWKNMKNTL